MYIYIYIYIFYTYLPTYIHTYIHLTYRTRARASTPSAARWSSERDKMGQMGECGPHPHYVTANFQTKNL